MARKKPKSKRGPALIAAWLKKNEQTLLGFSEIVECSKQTVGAIKQGDFTPSLSLAFRIEEATDGAVPAKSWVD